MPRVGKSNLGFSFFSMRDGDPLSQNSALYSLMEGSMLVKHFVVLICKLKFVHYARHVIRFAEKNKKNTMRIFLGFYLLSKFRAFFFGLCIAGVEFIAWYSCSTTPLDCLFFFFYFLFSKVQILLASCFYMFCRQRQDDKWEHDLYDEDGPQFSSMH